MFQRILVPVNFSLGSRRALATALTLRERHGSEVHLFHLAEPGENERFLAGVGGDAPMAGQGLIADAEQRLRRFVDNTFPGKSGEVAVRAHGGIDVVTALRKAAFETKATLVVLGARQRQTVFRTTLEKALRELDTPVMIVWAPAEAAH